MRRFGRAVIARDRIWLHMQGDSGVEDPIDLCVDEAEAVIATLRHLVDQHKAQLAPKGTAT